MISSDTDMPCILVEYADRGSLYSVITAARANGGHGALPWPRRLSMALDAALGLEYLHARSLVCVFRGVFGSFITLVLHTQTALTQVHCDLKSPNLLVDKVWSQLAVMYHSMP